MRIVASLLMGLSFVLPVHAQDGWTKPNVLLVITDDVGYGDIGSYGAPDIRTPNIDRLAKEGVRFTDFYAAPTCTPTRAALMTGRYQQRVMLERPIGNASGPAGELGLAATGRSLPQLLKNNGYATGIIGKWHLGYKPEYQPAAHGFDYFFGFLSGYTDYYQHTSQDGAHDLYENGAPVHVDGYMTDLITERSIKFIEQRAQQPFFLEVAYNAAHWPFQVPDHVSVAVDKGRLLSPNEPNSGTRADYAAMLERVDQGVGQILQVLRKRGIEKNTFIIFTNDNGGEWLSRNAPLFHRKDTVWEGGIRVPTIMKWQGVIPERRALSQVATTMDLTATILAATRSPVPDDARLEGMDLLPIVQGRSREVERTLFFRILLPRAEQKAVRQGDWKLVIDGAPAPGSPKQPPMLLFNLKKDISERDDQVAQHPEIVQRMYPLLTAWEKDVDAEARGRRQ